MFFHTTKETVFIYVKTYKNSNNKFLHPLNNIIPMKNKYFLYARKSTEWEDRQIQSLDDQIRDMKKIASTLNIEIIEIFRESKSAKAPWRPEFNEMIRRIENKEAMGIIAWKLDRLSRNPIDSALLQYMLQNGSLEKIIGKDREYTVYDSGLLMSVETWMANQYILDLKKAVKRWQNTKYEKWIRPSLVPIGYLNDKEERSIITDKERFSIVRKMWDLMLTGNYSIRKTIDTANNNWGLRTVKKRKSWGWELTRSSWERIFRNIFYTGYFYRNWELIAGIQDPMISLEEFDRVQRLLWKKWKPRPKQREFSYTGMIRCWNCGCMVTAETKSKYIKSTWETREYTYYHCTKKKRELNCKQKSILVEKLEDQIYIFLESIEIDTDFKKWIFEAIRENYNTEFEAREKIYNSLCSSIKSEEKKLKTLMNFLIDETLSKEEYEWKKIEIQENLVTLKKQQDKIDLEWKKTLNTVEEVFDFTFEITKSFNSWNLQEKKNIFSAIGNNFILKDWILTLELNPWYSVIKTEYPNIIRQYRGLEPTKKDTSKGLLGISDSEMFKW